jgi:hypothetical protein
LFTFSKAVRNFSPRSEKVEKEFLGFADESSESLFEGSFFAIGNKGALFYFKKSESGHKYIK